MPTIVSSAVSSAIRLVVILGWALCAVVPVSAQVFSPGSGMGGGGGGSGGGAAAGFSVITDVVDPDTSVDCTIGAAALGWIWNNVDSDLPNPKRWQCLLDDTGNPRWQFLSGSWQEAYEQGEHGLTDVSSTEPELFQPEKSLGGAKIERWGASLGISRRATDAGGNPMSPDAVDVWFNTAFDIYTETDDDPSTTNLIQSIENVAGTTTVKWYDTAGTVVMTWNPAAGNRPAWRGGRVYFPARNLEFDGTQCAEPTAALINSGPKVSTFLCGDNDAGIVYGDFPTKGSSYNGEAVTFTLYANHGTTETITCEFDFAVQAVPAGDPPTNTWSSTAPASLSITTANDDVQVTTAAITPSGTPGADVHIYWKATRDATASGANCANTKHKGVAMSW